MEQGQADVTFCKEMTPTNDNNNNDEKKKKGDERCEKQTNNAHVLMTPFAKLLFSWSNKKAGQEKKKERSRFKTRGKNNNLIILQTFNK